MKITSTTLILSVFSRIVLCADPVDLKCSTDICTLGSQYCNTLPHVMHCRSCSDMDDYCLYNNKSEQCLLIACKDAELQASKDKCKLEAETCNRTITDLNQKNADLNQKNTDLNQKNTKLNQIVADQEKEIKIYLGFSSATIVLFICLAIGVIICRWRQKGKRGQYEKDSNPMVFYVNNGDRDGSGDRDGETDQLMDHEDETRSNPEASQEEIPQRMDEQTTVSPNDEVVKQNKTKKSVKECDQFNILDAEAQTKVKECLRNSSVEASASPQACNNQLPEVDSMMTNETLLNLEASQEEIGEIETEPPNDDVIKRVQTQNFQTLEEKQQSKVKELHSNVEATAMPHIKNYRMPNHPGTNQDAVLLPPVSQNAPIRYQIPGQHTAQNPVQQVPAPGQNTASPHSIIYIINQNTLGNRNQSVATQLQTGDTTNNFPVKHVEAVDVTNEHERCDENKRKDRSNIAENSLSNTPRVREDTLCIPVPTDDQSAPTCVFDIPDFLTKF